MKTIWTATLLTGLAVTATAATTVFAHAQGFGGGPGSERKALPGFSYEAPPKVEGDNSEQNGGKKGDSKSDSKKRRDGAEGKPFNRGGRDDQNRRDADSPRGKGREQNPPQTAQPSNAVQPPNPTGPPKAEVKRDDRDRQRDNSEPVQSNGNSGDPKAYRDQWRNAPPGNRDARDNQTPPAVVKGAANPSNNSQPSGERQRQGDVRRADRGRNGVSTIEQIKGARRERSEDGGKRVVIEEPGRTIVKQNNRIVIQQDETERMRRMAPNARFEKRGNGNQVSIVERPGNNQIVTETDARGQMIRRYRRDRGGRETDIVDNRKRNRFGRDLAIGAGIGVGVVAGAAIIDSLVRVPPPRVRIPRDKYIVRYEGASEDDVYEALNAPPVDDIDRRYTLDQVRATPYLRDRMRRIDLDDITFDFGSWYVDPREFGKLERVARAMRRVIRRNPNEVFLIEGYTDAVGSQIDNLTLSDRRAESVADILTQEFNVPFENLVTQGYGEDYLKVPTQAPERLNRRVAARRVTPLIADRNAPPPRAYDDSRSDDGDDPANDERRDDERYDDRRNVDRGDDRGEYDPRR